jgi:hypothetical protein
LTTSVPSRRQLALVWLACAVLFGGLLLLSQTAREPGDDADPAWQRPGFLDAGTLPEQAPPVITGIPSPGRRAVVFFQRQNGVDDLCRAVAHRGLRERADVAIVVPDQGATCSAPVPVTSDPAAVVAERYGLRQPRGGGPPVGYAIVDSSGRIRYRTLDPAVTEELGEVFTILRATP